MSDQWQPIETWHPRRRERVNRQCAAFGFVLLLGVGEFSWFASRVWSWAALWFTICAAFAALCLGSALMLFWVAISVDAAAPPEPPQ